MCSVRCGETFCPGAQRGGWRERFAGSGAPTGFTPGGARGRESPRGDLDHEAVAAGVEAAVS
ncbi:Hypothetical protein CAP_0130 [Chondromyces apiculatus DSM 436]|uniref:Uncharacterized protein n=1 Tax=Chondromyces apiculatus DSM 436 TaxID=1192034 RepID=A0A017TEN1_9BACT|nr:Hypothetical protein CAP_0130 [Chondromyces apiculatus DSM 436]